MDDKATQVQFVDPFTVLVTNAKGFMRQVYTGSLGKTEQVSSNQ